MHFKMAAIFVSASMCKTVVTPGGMDREMGTYVE